MKFILILSTLAILCACTSVPVDEMNQKIDAMQNKVTEYNTQVSSTVDTLNTVIDSLEQ